jgi:hypothetical protein
MSQLSVLLTLVFVAYALNSAKAACLCCDEQGELIEFTVISCQAEPVNYKILGHRFLGKNDLVINGTINASVPITNKTTIDYAAQQKNLSINKKFVYEGRNEKTCDDFKPGSSKVMYYDDKDCAMIIDGEIIDDILCVHSDKKISELPFEILNLLENNQ